MARGEDSFGAAAATQLVQSINPNTFPAPFRGKIPGLPKDTNLAKDFDAHFNNFAASATHSNDIVQGIIGQLTQSSTNQHNKILKTFAELKSSLPLTGGLTISGGSGG